jgi:hypothetical protein
LGELPTRALLMDWRTIRVSGEALPALAAQGK